MSEPACSEVWDLPNRIQGWQTLGVWLTGAVGTVFVWHQNRILNRQNKIIKNQEPLNALLMRREEEREKQEKAMERLTLIDQGVYQADAHVDAALKEIADLGLNLQHAQAQYVAQIRSDGNARDTELRINRFNDKVNAGRKRHEVTVMVGKLKTAKREIELGCANSECSHRDTFTLDVLKGHDPKDVRDLLKGHGEDSDRLLLSMQESMARAYECPKCKKPLSKVE